MRLSAKARAWLASMEWHKQRLAERVMREERDAAAQVKRAAPGPQVWRARRIAPRLDWTGAKKARADKASAAAVAEWLAKRGK